MNFLIILNKFPEDLKNITKLICSTSLSESFNFEYISVVIDSRLVKESGLDIITSLTAMIETQASKEAMYQRKGRFGKSMNVKYLSVDGKMAFNSQCIPWSFAFYRSF